MQHQMKLSSVPFGKIVRREKVIESRLNDEKRQEIQVGDSIEFSENDHPENVVNARVKGVLRYQKFSDLFDDLNPSLFGGESSESLLEEIKRFYSDEEEAKYGVVGVRIEMID